MRNSSVDYDLLLAFCILIVTIVYTMATYENGFNGPFKGKLGKAVGYFWKGIPVMRSLPRKRGTKRGKLEKSNQSDFSFLHYWLQPLIEFLKAGFKGYSERVHAFNAAKSLALKNAFVGEMGERVFDPSRVQVSWGDLPLPPGIMVSRSGDFELTFSWETDPKADAGHKLDQVMMLAYDPANENVVYTVLGQFRKNGSDQLKLRKKGSYHIYAAFVAADRSRQSNSVYLGVVEID